MQWELNNSLVFWESEGSEKHLMDVATSICIWVAGSELDTKREGLSAHGTGLRAAGVPTKSKSTRIRHFPLLLHSPERTCGPPSSFVR